MQLTSKQDGLISGYLRDVAAKMDADLSTEVAESGVQRLEGRIRRELELLNKAEPSDQDVQLVLDRLGPPARQAAALRPAGNPQESLILAAENRVWLGVCAGIAWRVGMEPYVVRALAVLFGLVAPPLAIICYIGAYVEMYFASRKMAGPKPNWLRAFARAGAAFLIALVLYVGADYLLGFLYHLHELAREKPVPELGDWDTYRDRADVYFFWAILFCVPLGFLSGLPLAGGWDYSVKRMWQAGLALYAIVICFGIAGILVGVILDVVEEFGGIPFELPIV